MAISVAVATDDVCASSTPRYFHPVENVDAAGRDVAGATVRQWLRAPKQADRNPSFDRMAKLARSTLHVPVAMVTLSDQPAQVAAGRPDGGDAEQLRLLAASLCCDVIRCGAPVLASNTAEEQYTPTSRIAVGHGVGAYAAVPLTTASGVTVGALCVLDLSPHVWTLRDVRILHTLAGAATAQLELHQVASGAEHSRNRTALLLELSEKLAAVTSERDIVGRVEELALHRLGASSGGITVLDRSTSMLRHVTQHPVLRGASRPVPLDAATPSATVVRSALPLYFTSLREVDAAYPDVAPTAGLVGSSFACLPLFSGPSVCGSLVLSWADERVFDDADRDLLMVFAQYVAQALDRARLLQERRDVARTMQRALLPALPVIDGFELAGRYEPACVDAVVGGDWYDAFRLGRDSFGLVVGDVTGHDTEAAARMGQLRAELRALALTGTGQPAATLTALDTLINVIGPAGQATVLLGTISVDGDRTVFTWSNAGHPPPLLIAPGRPAHLLHRPTQPLLGLRHNGIERCDYRTELPPGATLVLFTDGLIERRTVGMDERLALLTRVAERYRRLDLADLLDAILEATGEPCHDDDTALFAVRRA